MRAAALSMEHVMNIIRTKEYRHAFGQYLRKGTPIRLTFKDQHATPQYVWRTRGDAKVRPEHAANEGRLFSWGDPPATGHPGEAHNCRCEAVPYIPGETE
jgi:SPP1 gp7 family putative phage head morphogenesis protein